MKGIIASFFALFVFLTVFAVTVSAAGSGGGEGVTTASAYDGPLLLLSILTLAVLIFLPFKDHN